MGFRQMEANEVDTQHSSITGKQQLPSQKSDKSSLTIRHANWVIDGLCVTALETRSIFDWYVVWVERVFRKNCLQAYKYCWSNQDRTQDILQILGITECLGRQQKLILAQIQQCISVEVVKQFSQSSPAIAWGRSDIFSPLRNTGDISTFHWQEFHWMGGI